MYRYFATHFSMYCTAGIYNSILNQVGGQNTVLQQAFVHNGIPFVSDIPTIIFGADVSHPPPGMYSSSIAGVRFSLLLRICFCFTTMASYREINILAHYIKNLKLNSTSLLLSPSNFFLKGLVPPILLWVNTLLCQILLGGWINRLARSHHIQSCYLCPT